MKRLGITKNYILENFSNLNNYDEEHDYQIELAFEDFPRAVKLGKTKKERIQILMMCYMTNPTVYELLNWKLDDVLVWIRHTDDFYVSDKVYIDECIKLINEKE